jgi:hypothetical protein
MRSGRPAGSAARATTLVAVDVKATCVAMADQPQRGGRWRRKRRKTRPRKRSVLVRLPNSWAVQVGGKQEPFFCLLPIPGMTATAPSTPWIHLMNRSLPIACIQKGQEQEEMSFLLLPFRPVGFPTFVQ